MGIATAVFAAAMNVITLQLGGIQEEAPAFNYTTIPFWLMAAVLVVLGIAQRRSSRG
ncbi:MAG TPA: hypothetical protein VJ739_02700 [Gemmataceae bacterium]|nr:hypothetical protein [Gemmataceae bacterium]